MGAAVSYAHAYHSLVAILQDRVPSTGLGKLQNISNEEGVVSERSKNGEKKPHIVRVDFFPPTLEREEKNKPGNGADKKNKSVYYIN